MIIENSFSPSDLIRYTEELLKESQMQEIYSERTNYGWLKARNIQIGWYFIKDLEKMKPMILKLSPEHCARIAVKLDSVTDDISTTSDILITFKKLVEEEYKIQLLERNIKIGKETKNMRTKYNKVHPDLSAEGRQPTVSFIL